MNTSKSLPALLGYYFNHWSSAASIGDVEAMKRVKAEAAEAIVEAVEGLAPKKKSVTEMNMTFYGKEFQQIKGYNQAVDEFLQAIKEWQ